MIKNIPGCTECSRKKKAQSSLGSFIPNVNDQSGLAGITRKYLPKGALPEAGSEQATSPSGQPSGQGSTGSSALSTGATAATGAAVGSKAMGGGGATATGLGSRLMGAGRFLGQAGAVALPAVGSYFGAKYIEDLIGSALAASTELKPAIRYSTKNIILSESRLVNLKSLVTRMTNLSSHVDNNAIKLGTVIGKTLEELEKAKKASFSKIISKNKR